MSPDNLQHFADQHLALFLAGFALYFIGLWLLISTLISLIGGWFALSKFYRMRTPFSGQKVSGQSGQMRWLTNYSRILTLGANQRGLYLASMFLFRFMQPPLLIPWEEVKVRRSKGWFFEYVTFTLGRELSIPLRIRSSLAEKLRNTAGNRWPVEDT